MRSDRYLFIGVGQCGNNIISEMACLGYSTFAINTSELDLQSINVEHKYKIPGALGCARDRKKALNYLKGNYNKIIKTIEDKFSGQDLIYFIFSLGGGTGSGMCPLLIDALSRKYKNKHFGAVVVAPSNEESIQCKMNAVECYKEIIGIPRLKSIFILDNNSSNNKMDINSTFSSLFDSVVNMTKANKMGLIDDYELERLLTTKGSSIIVKSDMCDMGDTKIIEPSIFIEHEKSCMYIGASIATDFDMSILENEFGKPKDIFKGYNDSSNLLIVTGMPYPMAYFRKLDMEVMKFSSQEVGLVVDCDIDTSKYRSKDIELENIKDIDFESLFDSYK